MLNKIFSTADEVSVLVLRVVLAIVFFPHGSQKVLGWFGGYGFGATMDTFTNTLGIPVIPAFLAIMAEFLGSLGLFVGLLTRVAALGIFSVMAVAVPMLHLKHGFFMNWFGNQQGEGFEYHLLVMAIAVALMIKGGGKWSLDAQISKKLE